MWQVACFSRTTQTQLNCIQVNSLTNQPKHGQYLAYSVYVSAASSMYWAFSLKGKLLFSRTWPQLPTLTKSDAMFPNISAAPALLTPVHRVVREQEAQAAVTLNDSMNRPGPFRAHCLAVSCFDMGPNTSLLHLAKGFGFRALFMRGKTAVFGSSQPAETRAVLFCLAEREWLRRVAHTRLDGCQSLLLISPSDHPSVCLSLCLPGSLVSYSEKGEEKRLYLIIWCLFYFRITEINLNRKLLKQRPTLSPEHTPMLV